MDSDWPRSRSIGGGSTLTLVLLLGCPRVLAFAKFREKFASGAAGAEISRNLPLTAPLASQAHAVHMYRISIKRCIWLPVTRWTSTVPDLKLSRHLRPQPPIAPPRCAPRAVRRARSSGPTLVPSPAAPAPRSLMFGDQQWAALGDYIQAALSHSCSSTTSVRLAESEVPQFNPAGERDKGFQNPPLTEEGNGLVK